jgi:ADP-heptose:LPS heptosyltransferase
MPLIMFIRRFAYRIIALYDRWAVRKTHDDTPHGISRILMTELTRIGDVLVTTPVARAMKNQYPNAEITYVVQDLCMDIFRRNPHVDHVIGIPSGKGPGSWVRALAAARQWKPDLAVSLSPGLKNAGVTHFCGAKYRVGYLNDRSGMPHFLKDHPIEARGFTSGRKICYHKNEHLTIRAAKAVLPLHVKCPGQPVEFFLGSESLTRADAVLQDGKLRIVVHPTSGWPFKSWPEDRFIGLLSRIKSHFRGSPLQLILLGGHRDSPLLSRINTSLGGDLTIVEGSPLPVAGAVIRGSHLFVGNDSGPLHMAGAFEIPFVGIFGPSLPGTTGPLSEGVFVRKEVACAPCTQTVCLRATQGLPTCMELIEVETVFRAVLERLQDQPSALRRHQP